MTIYRIFTLLYSLSYKFIRFYIFIPDKIDTSPLNPTVRKPRGRVVEKLVLGHTFTKR